MTKRKRVKSLIRLTLEQQSRQPSPRSVTFTDRRKEASRRACRSTPETRETL